MILAFATDKQSFIKGLEIMNVFGSRPKKSYFHLYSRPGEIDCIIISPVTFEIVLLLLTGFKRETEDVAIRERLS